jgi:hypothetical protein
MKSILCENLMGGDPNLIPLGRLLELLCASVNQ